MAHRVVYLILTLQVIVHCSSVSNKNRKLLNDRIQNYWEYAQNLSQSLNQDFNPCYNYYEYVCSKSDMCKKSRNLRVLSTTQKENLLLNYEPKSEDENIPQMKMLNFYKSCTAMRNKQSVREFFENWTFPNSTGGWPIFSTGWDKDNFDFVSTLSIFQRYGISSLFEVHLSQGYVYLTEKRFQEIFEILRTAKDLYFEHGIENAEDVIVDRITFKLLYTYAIKSLKDDTVLITNFKGLKELFSDFDWDKYFHILFNRQLEDDYVVKVNGFDKIKKLVTTFKKVNPKIIVNYLFSETFNKVLSFNEGKMDCLSTTFDYFSEVYPLLIMDSYYNDDFRTTFLDITGHIVKYLEINLGTFNNTTADEILNEIQNFVSKSFLQNINKRVQSLETYAITPDNYYENMFELTRFKIFESFSNVKMDHPENVFSLDYIYRDVLYLSHNQMPPVLYNLLMYPIVSDLIFATDFALLKISEGNSNRTQADQIFHSSEIGASIVSSFCEWTKQNKKLLKEEIRILKDFGMSLKKVFFADLVMRGWHETVSEYDRTGAISILKSAPDFADEYKCTKGTPMNPMKECENISGQI